MRPTIVQILIHAPRHRLEIGWNRQYRGAAVISTTSVTLCILRSSRAIGLFAICWAAHFGCCARRRGGARAVRAMLRGGVSKKKGRPRAARV